MTNKEIIQISKSKPKKISILCTFKRLQIRAQLLKNYPDAWQQSRLFSWEVTFPAYKPSLKNLVLSDLAPVWRYEAKEAGFCPGGATLHSMMTPHGPDAQCFNEWSEKELGPIKVQKWRHSKASL